MKYTQAQMDTAAPWQAELMFTWNDMVDRGEVDKGDESERDAWMEAQVEDYEAELEEAAWGWNSIDV